MAQLKDLIVNGASRLIGDAFANKIFITTLADSTGNVGTNGQVLKSNGTDVIWGSLTTGVSGVKGNAESTYRTGQVNLTPANIGAAPIASPALTGTPTAPTAAAGTNTTQIATTAFVMSAFTTNDALVFKGVANSNSDLPATHKQGWVYKVGTAGTYAGVTCEIGDTIYCVTDGTAANNAHWCVIQANVDAPLYKDGNTFSGSKILLSDSTGGKVKEGTITSHSYTPAGTVSKPTFSGTSFSSTGTFTPAGTNAKSAVTIKATTTNVYSMTSAGSVTAGSAASLTMKVENEILSFTWTANTPTSVTLPGRSSAIAAWTGYTTGVNNTYAAAQTFTGTQGNISVSGTPTGTVSQPTFSGTAATLSHSVS